MKRCEIEPTEENIKETLSKNVIGRNEDIYNFLSILDTIEGNMVISLDGEWGSGKTFFVKQMEMLLNYYRNESFHQAVDSGLKKMIEENNSLKKIQLKNGFIPIYYNAWLYDDHNDPVLSLMYAIVKDNGIEYITETKSKLSKNVGKILNILAFFTRANFNFENITDWKESDNIIDQIGTLESVKALLQEVFDEIIAEHGDKIVVFIDELDRCNPRYAITVLERIKHFFTDERIIFVYSTNKSQLIHTINKFYGNSFDASGYLNKFFDFSVKLGKIDIVQYAQSLDIIPQGENFFNEIVYSMVSYYNFSMRDCNRYFQNSNGYNEYIKNYHTKNKPDRWLLILYIPIILALRIVDVEKSVQFEQGDLFEELQHIVLGNLTVKIAFEEFFKMLDRQKKDVNQLIQGVKDMYEDIFKSRENNLIVTSSGRKSLKKTMGIIKL